MKTIQLATNVRVYQDRTELPEDTFNLLEQAELAAKKAYAKYSQFKVGAAVLLNNGMIINGNNQENAVYPTGLCAERTAVFYASSQYPEVPITKIAVTAIHPQNPLTIPVPPCGSCRQVLLEYEQKFNQPIEVIMAGESGEVYVVASVSELLPCNFNEGFLK
ncbi:MAG: cytidine deaminase [Bacteroidales bacterium]|jgi:cytidine deaminase|nr:cytidine deaminase [Bacteroidales bacterium]